MFQRSRSRLGIAVGAVAVGLLATSCVSAPAPSSPGTSAESETTTEGLDDYYGQTLDWSDCGAAECAELVVPKDYDDPSQGEFKLAVLKKQADGESKGALVLNPGGPGGSGVDYARLANAVLPTSVNEVFDVVGFDPRGVADSDPVDCLTDAETDAWLAADGSPATPQEAEELAKTSAEYGAKCAELSADIYPYLSTDAVVKDLDVLRAALGEEKLNYIGKSYGTLIGALYAEAYPDKVGRVVLDGVLPPDLTAEEVGKGQADGFEDTLRRYAKDCQAKSECPLKGNSVDAGVKQIQDFLADLKAKPIKAKPDRPLTQSLALGAILYHLYFPAFGDWDKVSAGLADAFDGDGEMLLGMYDERLERSASGKYADNSQDAFYAVTCLDRAAEGDTSVLADRAEAWAKDAPTFGPFMAWSDLVCASWPTEATGSARKVTAAGANPILVVSTTHDPATPYAWAKRLAADLDDAKLVSWDQDGHTAYFNGSNCVDKVVDAYLLRGKSPASDVKCPK